jgi:hypothetical protein
MGKNTKDSFFMEEDRESESEVKKPKKEKKGWFWKNKEGKKSNGSEQVQDIKLIRAQFLGQSQYAKY